LLLAACFSGLVTAGLSYGEALPDDEALSGTSGAIVWPVLPGESLNRLATLFYPKNRTMQQRFVAKTLELNRDHTPHIEPGTIFAQADTVVIPELKALSRYASPFKAHAAPHRLRMSFQIEDVVKALITPEMLADYEALKQRNEFLKIELQKLHERLSGVQSSLVQLKTAALAFIQNSQAVPRLALSTTIRTEPQTRPEANRQLKPHKEPQAKPVQVAVKAEPVTKSAKTAPVQVPTPMQKSLHKIVAAGRISADAIWIRILIQFIMIIVALIMAIAAWFWIRKRLFRQIEDVTNDQINAIAKNSSFSDISNSFDLTKSGMFEQEQNSTLFIEEFDSVVEEAKILISMDRPAQAISVLLEHIGAHPETSLHAWLYLLDVYRSQGQKEEFSALARRLHTAFNVMTPQWETGKIAMVVAHSLEEFPHLVEQLTEAWANDQAEEYLASLLNDNREGERAGFSLEVLQEIMLLQAVWGIRKAQ
jgi:hypothetical protein